MELLGLSGVSPASTSDWGLLRQEVYPKCEEMVVAQGGAWQIPIIAAK
jgi:hypothetical protein